MSNITTIEPEAISLKSAYKHLAHVLKLIVKCSKLRIMLFHTNKGSHANSANHVLSPLIGYLTFQ